MARTRTQFKGFFSTLKRRMGVYQRCSEEHLQGCLDRFDFLYNQRAGLEIDDTMRVDAAIRGVSNKRLTYRRTNGSRKSSPYDRSNKMRKRGRELTFPAFLLCRIAGFG